jgi:glycosyltransferase involved in cell wall biosynthesis
MSKIYKKTVSVIIPVYNEEKTLKQCLKSVINQKYDNFEIIVVDNNSTDKTKSIIQSLQKNDKKIKYVFEEKKGRGSARNAGIKNASGEIIAMTDSDCIVPKNWILEITKDIQEEKELIVMGFEESASDNFWSKNTQKRRERSIKKIKSGYANGLDTKNFAIDANLLKKYMFDSQINSVEDLDFFMRVKNQAKIRFKKNIIVHHFHDDCLVDFIKTNFRRGFWTSRIYQKYKNTSEKIIFKNLQIINFLKAPFWILFIFVTVPFDWAYFLSVQEISWRVGVISEKISFLLNKNWFKIFLKTFLLVLNIF